MALTYQQSLQAMAEATQLHHDLQLDIDKPIDVFSVIAQHNLWLWFSAMDRILGVYMAPTADSQVGGIMINSQRPLSMQRFTAAHELGHHILEHKPSLDDESMLTRDPSHVENWQEGQADVFAGYFLMPEQLIATVFKRHHLPLNQPNLTPELAYRLALEMGVSYEAFLRHMRITKRISGTLATALKKAGPATAKRQLLKALPDFKPPSMKPDIWTLNVQDSGQLYEINAADEVLLKLPESPSTGYRWAVVGPPPTSNLQVEYDGFVLPEGSQSVMGAAGVRVWVIKAEQPGTHNMQLIHRCLWEDQPQKQPTFHLHLLVRDKPAGGDTGIYTPQRELLPLR